MLLASILVLFNCSPPSHAPKLLVCVISKFTTTKMDGTKKRKISADLPPDLREDDDDVIGPMPAQADSKPEKKKRKGNVEFVSK